MRTESARTAAAAKRPSLRVSRASRLAVRHGAPGRDNSRSVASIEIVLSSRCTRMSPAMRENDSVASARRRPSSCGCSLRLVTAGPMPRAETRIEPCPAAGTRKLSGSIAAH